MMFEALLEASQYFVSPFFWVLLLAGTLIGLTLGIIPALGGMVGVALLMPFVIVLKNEESLAFLIALTSVTYTGGAITAILLNIPGTAPNAATLIDGFPMAQKGEAGRAIGAALASSGMGGMLSGFLALGMIPLLIPIIMAVGTSDMVLIMVVGLAFIGVLGGRSMIKGLISGGLGLLFAFIGHQASTGIERFTFSTLYLYDGLKIIPVALGLFALPAVVDLAVRGGTIAKSQVAYRGLAQVWEGIKDVFRHWALWLRSSIIGYIVGVIPGVGGDVATFVSYGQAKQLSKKSEMYGTGIIEGVIAPESANNGKEGGALLTTLALGIPGSAVMALILGAIYMLGIVPGPTMLTEHLPLSLSMVLVTIVANLIGVFICLPFVSQLVKVALIPSAILVPIVVAIVLVGSFSYGEFFNNIIVTIIFGILGVAMAKFGYSRPALILGFILGYLFERNFFWALGIHGPTFFMTPISLTIIVVLIGLFIFNPIKNQIKKRRGARIS